MSPTAIPGYTVIRPLGRGGMAAVYLARQESLGREVALKVLQSGAETDSAVAAERFLREARIAASLHHPHIVPIHDFGVHEGTAYLAMEYEPGGTIAPMAGEKLAPRDALRVVRDIAGALDYAHGRGVVHRDIKPDNILRRDDGAATLSDFGIARLLQGDSVLTTEGTSVGTPHYMSPEQLRGEKVDGRGDLYSLGIVLWQLLTGEQPFTGNDSWAIGMQHINAPVPRLPEGLAHLQPLLDTLLAKQPDARLDSGAELVRRIDVLLAAAPTPPTSPATRAVDAHASVGSAAIATPTPAQRPSRVLALAAVACIALGVAGWLGWQRFGARGGDAASAADQAALPIASIQSSASGSASSSPPAADKSIAVLPFLDMSQNKDQEYFSDGIAEELLNRLAKFPDLLVAARTSAFQFKGKALDVAEIGRQLRVAHVLEGSVRKSGARLRITAQLIDTKTGYHLWSETYDRDAADIFKVQDEISKAIADELKARLVDRPGAATRARTANLAAYDDYLKGRGFIALRRVANLDKAVAAFDRAIALDPDYSAAHSGRAFASLLLPMWNAPGSPEAAFAAARTSAEKALRLDPGNAEAYMVRGTAAFFRKDASAATADLDRALALAPGSVDVLNMDGDFRLSVGDLGAAERDKRQAMALDPLAFVHILNLSDVFAAQGRYAESAAAAEQSVALGAGEFGDGRRVFAYSRLGRVDDAKAATEKVCAVDPDSVLTCMDYRVRWLAAGGQRPQAKALLDDAALKIRNGRLKTGEYDAALMAALYVEVGDIPKATRWQRTALDEDSGYLTYTLTGAPGGAKLPEELSRDPDWLAVWADPRLKDVMAVYRRNLLAWRACARGGDGCR